MLMTGGAVSLTYEEESSDLKLRCYVERQEDGPIKGAEALMR